MSFRSPCLFNLWGSRISNGLRPGSMGEDSGWGLVGLVCFWVSICYFVLACWFMSFNLLGYLQNISLENIFESFGAWCVFFLLNAIHYTAPFVYLSGLQGSSRSSIPKFGTTIFQEQLVSPKLWNLQTTDQRVFAGFWGSALTGAHAPWISIFTAFSRSSRSLTRCSTQLWPQKVGWSVWGVDLISTKETHGHFWQSHEQQVILELFWRKKLFKSLAWSIPHWSCKKKMSRKVGGKKL